MKCPACKSPMIILELNDVEIDFCTDCKGIWLDRGELELLLEESTSSAEILKTFNEIRSTKEKKIKCPICKKKMLKVNVGKEDVVLLDSCQNGDGLWFDEGELFDIISKCEFDNEHKIIEQIKEMFNYKINN